MEKNLKYDLLFTDREINHRIPIGSLVGTEDGHRDVATNPPLLLSAGNQDFS